MNVSLISSWKESWKFFSVWAMGAVVAIQGAWMTVPDEVKAMIPEEWVSRISVILAIVGIIGRLIKQIDQQTGAVKIDNQPAVSVSPAGTITSPVPTAEDGLPPAIKRE